MGRLFLEHLGGESMFLCRRCETYLTCRKECRSENFQGSTGQAFLFDRVVNIRTSRVVLRSMTTGKHIVRDVFCKRCDLKLGWMYEFAYDPTQTYKEGRVILERKCMRECKTDNIRQAEINYLNDERCRSVSSIGSSSSIETMT